MCFVLEFSKMEARSRSMSHQTTGNTFWHQDLCNLISHYFFFLIQNLPTQAMILFQACFFLPSAPFAPACPELECSPSLLLGHSKWQAKPLENEKSKESEIWEKWVLIQVLPLTNCVPVGNIKNKTIGPKWSCLG